MQTIVHRLIDYEDKIKYRFSVALMPETLLVCSVYRHIFLAYQKFK